jgi:hypothetical protein
MPHDLAALLADLRQDGAQRFASWAPALFDAVGAGPALTLWCAFEGQPDAERVLRGYLHLAQEAIGIDALRQPTAPAPGASWTSFLERCLIQFVPQWLPALPPEQRLPALVKVWNLGEGLRREPDWVDRYVTACSGKLSSLLALEAFLIDVLAPVLTPAPPSAWKGPFRVTLLDLRPFHEEILPGKLHLAAPTVLCVPDRRLPGTQVGILLRPEGKSEVLGLTQGLGEYVEPEGGPAVTFEDQRTHVAGQVVNLPFLRRCHHHVVARAGFVACCAVDSQRLWIVETP